MIPAQIAQRLCSEYLSVREPVNVNVDHQLLLLDAINRGIGEYYDLVPARFRSKTWGARLGTGGTGTGTATNGSTTVTIAGTTPISGSTIVLSGDTVENRIHSQNSVWSLEIPYGGSTGAFTFTWYKDTALIPWTLARFITPPRNPSTGENYREVLPGAEVAFANAGYARGYRVEQFGADTVLRLIPRPTGDTPVSATVEIASAPVTALAQITTFTGVSDLPIHEDHCSRLLMPLIGAALIGHPLWADPAKAAVALSKADKARADIRLLRPKTTTGPSRICAPFP